MVSIQDPGAERSVQRIEIRGRVSLRPQHVAPSLEVRQIIRRAKIPDPAVEVLLLVAPQPELLADLADFDTVRMRAENREEPAVDRSQAISGFSHAGRRSWRGAQRPAPLPLAPRIRLPAGSG